MDSNSCVTVAELRKLACELGVKIELCNRSGQLSCAARLASAREDVLTVVHNYNPGIDERQLDLKTDHSTTP